MPLYMDRHDVPGITAAAVAEAHVKDLAIQQEYGCVCMTYWVDEERENAFCLIYAPDADSVKEMHRHAHGLVPYDVIEVEDKVVHSFLGRVYDPKISMNNNGLKVFAEPAFRCILSFDVQEQALLNCRYGNTTANELLTRFYEIVHQVILSHRGSLVENHEDLLGSFASISNAVDAAAAIQEEVGLLNAKNTLPAVAVSIGISAGEPVTRSNDFFGDTIRVAKRLSFVAGGGKIYIPAVVKEKYKGTAVNMAADEKIKILKGEDETLLNSLFDLLDAAADEDGLENFCARLAISRSNFYRKINSLTGYSPNDFLQEVRLQKALRLMHRHQKNITEAALEAGFSTSSYFTKCFKKRFDVLPTEFLKSIG